MTDKNSRTDVGGDIVARPAVDDTRGTLIIWLLDFIITAVFT